MEDFFESYDFICRLKNRAIKYSVIGNTKLQSLKLPHVPNRNSPHNMLIHNVDIYARGVDTLMLNSVITWSIARFIGV